MGERTPVRSVGVLLTAGSSVVVGVLGLFGLVAAARGLGAADYTSFAVIWGVVYGVGGAHAGLQQEVTRAVVKGDARPDDEPPMVGRAALLTLPVAAVGAVATVLASPGDAGASATIVGVGLVGMGMLTFTCGVVSAHGRWGALAVLLVTDAVIRTVAIVMLIGTGGQNAVPLAVVSGSVLWSVLLVFPAFRATWAQRGAGDLTGFLRRGSVAVVSAGCAALVVAGLPLLVEALRREHLGADAGAAIAAMSLIRSAFLLLVYGFRPMLLRHLLHTPRPTTSVIWMLVAGAAYTLGVGLLGPALLPFLLGGSFTVSALECVGLGVGTTGLGLLVVSGLALLARDRHLAAGMGWLTALVASVVSIPLAPTPELAVLVAAAAAPWLGVVAHAGALAASGPRRWTAQSRPSENADSRSWRE